MTDPNRDWSRDPCTCGHTRTDHRPGRWTGSGPLRVQSPRGTCTRCRCEQWDIDTAAMLAAERELREARLAAIYADERLAGMIRGQL